MELICYFVFLKGGSGVVESVTQRVSCSACNSVTPIASPAPSSYKHHTVHVACDTSLAFLPFWNTFCTISSEFAVKQEFTCKKNCKKIQDEYKSFSYRTLAIFRQYPNPLTLFVQSTISIAAVAEQSPMLFSGNRAADEIDRVIANCLRYAP